MPFGGALLYKAWDYASTQFRGNEEEVLTVEKLEAQKKKESRGNRFTLRFLRVSSKR